MYRLKSVFAPLFVVLFMAVIMSSCADKTSVNPKFDIASADYEKLTEQYMQHLANFEWDASYELLADDVVYKLPDGDSDTRTTFKGLDAVKAHWANYQQNSGNDKIVIKDFVHVPVQVNQMDELIGVTGVFDICYFSAELSYGPNKANVRMHWAFHFNDDKKIDGIFTYYDRTPIIKAANKNFLSDNAGEDNQNRVVQIIKLKSNLPEEELLAKARERAQQFKEVPGLIQKYYLRLDEPGRYCGVYIWDSKASMQAFLKSGLAAGIGKAYQVVEGPDAEISDLLFQLR